MRISHQIDGPITDEQVDVFIYVQKLDKESANFVWNQTELVKRAVVYRGDMLYVSNQFAAVNTRA